VAEHRFHSTGLQTAVYALELVATLGIGFSGAVLWPSLAERSPVAVGLETGLVLAVVAALLSAWVSLKLLGTALPGSFLVGIALSQSAARRHAIERALGWSVPVILVPGFLAGAGARVDPGMLDLGVLAGAAVFTVLLVAVAMLAGSVSSRFPGLGASDASAIAALLNCRGMMLLALGVEMRDHRLIGPRLVAVFFIGAVATTMMTGPLFARAQRFAHRAASRNRARPPAWSLPRGTAVAGDVAPRPPAS
jgi:Kef-type K+ transport system membrane component KefB